MPTPKIELNTVYISERVRESLRSASSCALTAVTAPLGYVKTTAVNRFLAGRIKAEHAVVVRINIYSDKLLLLWKSVRKAFAAAGMDFLVEYSLPTDQIGIGMLTDELCRSLVGETFCYIFLDDFHPLRNDNVDAFIYSLANVLPKNAHIIAANCHAFPQDGETVRLGSKLHIIGKDTLRLNHTELSVYTERCGIELSDSGNKLSMLKVIAADRAEQLSYLPNRTTVKYISECSNSDLSEVPYVVLVIMRRYFSWRMMPEMLHLRDLLTENVNKYDRFCKCNKFYNN